jgi:hypothetical protein
MRKMALAMAALVLAGCTPTHKMSVTPAQPSPQTLAGAYIPVRDNIFAVVTGNGMGVAFADGVAVTTAANAGALAAGMVVGKSDEFGLLFFPSQKYLTEAPMAESYAGEKVTAYGQGAGIALRMLDGTVIAPECSFVPGITISGCSAKTTFMFEGDASAGFVGGPVIDAKTGRLVGIVSAYAQVGGRHLVYATRVSVIRAELDKIISAAPGDPD